MGVWGRKLYENDTAQDVKDIIDAKLEGASDYASVREDILDMLKSEYDDPEDQCLAWLLLRIECCGVVRSRFPNYISVY